MLPDDVRAFVRASIKSIWALELLLFLRAHADRSWSIADLARELRASDPIIRGGLGLFRAADLVIEQADGSIRFAPASSKLDNLVQAVAAIYANRPLAISNEIYAPESKIQHFADAFRIKKE